MTERFWAPWRIEYIVGPKPEGCVFCDFAIKPASEHREALILAKTEHAFVVQNRYPFASGHVLVIPRRHVSELEELEEREYLACMSLVRETVRRLRQVLRPEGVNVGFNLGKAAGAGIAEHLHAHVVPRWNGDTNFMPVLADVRVMPQYLDETWQRLEPAFRDLQPG